MRILFSILLFISSGLLFSQQIPIHSQYIHDRYLINPAFAGNTDYINASLNIRQQFMGIEGAPKTEILSFHAPIQSKYMGVGCKLVHDQIGASSTISFMGTYAYQIGVGNGKLAFAVEGGVINQQIGFVDLIVGDYEFDNVIPNENSSITIPDASFGAYFYDDNLYVGYSVYHLIKGNIDYTKAGLNKQAMLRRHHFLNAGYTVETGGAFSFEPSVLLKSVKNVPFQYDISAKATYKNQYSTGLLYRSGDAICILFNITLKENYQLAYSYDLGISKLNNYINGGHEIMLRYRFKLLPPAGQKEVHPIYYIR